MHVGRKEHAEKRKGRAERLSQQHVWGLKGTVEAAGAGGQRAESRLVVNKVRERMRGQIMCDFQATVSGITEADPGSR